MDKVTVGSIVMTWDAVTLVNILTRWSGTDNKSFSLLGDGGSLTSIDAEMFDLGNGLLLKAFAHKVEAHSWPREEEIPV